VVYFESATERSGQVPVQDEIFPATAPLTYGEVGFYKDSLTFTDETVEDLVSQAKSAKTQVALAKALPWLSVGGGVVLVGAGVFLARRRPQGSTAA
jgi:hypothetical protein